MASITVNGNTVEGQNQSPNAGNSNFVLLQGHHVLTVDEKQELEEHGISILEYVAENTYLCRYEPHDIECLRHLDFVQTINVYDPQLKITVSLRDMMDNEPDENVYEIDLILHETPNKTPEQLASRVAEVSGVAIEELEVLPRKIRLTVDQNRIEELAKLDSVNRIEEVRPNTLWNDQAGSSPEAREMPGLEELPYKGSGQVVCVADSGFDRGIAVDTDDAKVHPAFTNRVARLLSIWTGRDASDPIGHGTHVCGSVCGAGSYKDSKGSTISVQGSAPAASIMVQAMSKHTGKKWDIRTPADTSQLFSDAYQSGARVHSNSWGKAWPDFQLGYEQDATAIDIFVCENPDFTVLVAAGNNAREANHGESQIGANASAKNCITVGAVGTARPNDGYGYNLTGRNSAGVTDVAEFSSRGPTLATKDKNSQTATGRIKPDVVAPGVAILSAASRGMDPLSGLRTRFGKTDDVDYMYMAGTSMATPLVAGCVALLREVLAEQQGKSHPSAALLKALLINGAIKDVDAKSPNPIFDYQKGFGRVDVKKSIALIKQATFLDGGNLLDETSPPRLGVMSEEEKTWESPPLDVPRGGTIIATLTYPDPPGALLQNDVHLIVRSGAEGKERHGNMAENDSGFDMINNVEKIVWHNVPGPTARIIVRAHAFTLPNFKQSFAVAWDVQEGSA